MSGLFDLASPSKNSDGAESGNATKKESGLNLDGTDEENGSMREKACNIMSPQSNESNVLVLPATSELQPRMADVKGLNLDDGTESGNGRT